MTNDEDYRFPIEILQVIDGDGFKARAQDGTNRELEVRLYAIDAPEGRQKYGREATKHLRILTKAGRFWLVTKGQDRHGRTIAIVYRDGVDAEHTLNYAMVRDGWAYWYSRYEREYNRTPEGELELTEPLNELGLKEAEQQAHTEGKGVWIEPDVERPWQYKIRVAEERERSELLSMLLFEAISVDNTFEMSRLLNQGIDPNIRNAQGYTPLHLAARSGQAEMLQALLELGVDVDPRDATGHTPLHLTAFNQIRRVRDLLIAAGADISAVSDEGYTPIQLQKEKRSELLCEALNSGKTLEVPKLLSDGINHEFRDTRGYSPLDIVAINGLAEWVDMFWKAGADPNARDKRGRTPLHHAALNGKFQTYKLLISAGADIDARDDYGQTPHQIRRDTRKSDLRGRALTALGLLAFTAAAALVLFILS
ncbi:MAG: ankyrin repeat domain-containing protein [Chloroflexi bacterium]|nr:ankyrin repeat domain-containing protein [Chloroflexota bacterium]